MNLRSAVKSAKLGLRAPSLAIRKLTQQYNRFCHGEPYNTNGIDLMANDWDNLIVLDACRYDLFKEHNTIDGELSSVESRGSATHEWLYGNFHGRELWDTVYVTGNPMLYRRRDDVDVEFHGVIEVWQGDGWDEEEGTVLPGTMADAVREAAKAYPNKRLLCHFMQPHYPFIGSNGGFGQGFIMEEEETNQEPWLQLKIDRLDVGREAIWDAYVDNLRIALPAVRGLIKELDGKSIVTSDHGNMLGERAGPVREWGHPPHIYTDELIRVPWLECPTVDRREVIATEPSQDGSELNAESVVQSRLSELGYI